MKSKNNKALHSFLEDCSNQLKNINNKNDLSLLLDRLIAFPYQIAFDLKWHYGVVILFSLCTGLFFYYNFSLWFILGSALIAIITLVMIVMKHNEITNLNSQIKNRLMMILYKGDYISQNDLNVLEQQFYDFYRHNHSNHLTDGIEIDFHSSMGVMRVKVVSYEGIEKKIVTYTDSKGRVRTKIEYEHYYRQGVIIHNQPISSLMISESNVRTHFQESFKPASNNFNDLFYVQGEQQFEIAKFLEPDIVLQLEQAGNIFPDLTVEFNELGDMLICQKNTDLLDLTTNTSIREPEKFKAEIFKASCKNLDIILGFANRIIKQMN